MDENIPNDCRSVCAFFPFPGKSARGLLPVKCKIMPVGIDCTACSLNLTPPVACLKEEGSVCAGQRAKHIFLQPNRFISSFTCCTLLAVENTRKHWENL